MTGSAFGPHLPSLRRHIAPTVGISSERAVPCPGLGRRVLGAVPGGALVVPSPVDHLGQRSVLLLVREIPFQCPQGIFLIQDRLLSARISRAVPLQ